jgi:hypothetical protein
MRFIRCTQKLLKEIGVSPIDVGASSSDLEGLGHWYANVIRLDRKKCLLFTNEKTLYSFLIPGVLKRDLKNIKNEFVSNLIFNLQHEGFGLEVVNRVRDEYKEIDFAKTASKSILGSMNDFALQYEVLLPEAGIEHVKILHLNQKINKTPMSAIHYDHPIERLKNLLQ